MAYRAEIEIGVKGAAKLAQFKKSLEAVNKQINEINKLDISRRFPVQSIQNYVKNLNLASDTLEKVAAGTQNETAALRNYARAITESNANQQRQNRLLQEQITKFEELQRVQRQATGFSAAQYGPRLPADFNAVRKAAEVRTKVAEDASIKEINTRRREERRLLSELIDGDLERAQLRAKKNQEFFEQTIRLDNKAGENFDRRLNASIRKTEQLRLKQRKQLKEDLLLGAGFPLLFGGGPGAVLGGVGGALAGGGRGGFGLQIFGSAIGQQLDAIAQDALNTATALTSTAGALDFVREKSLFSSDAVKEQAAVLEEQGDVAGLAALLTGQLAEKIGNQGVQSLVDLGQTTNETTRLWNELTLQLQALISGPLNDFLKIVNSVLRGATTGLRREAFFESLGEDEAAARARFKQLTGESLGTGKSGAAKRAEARSRGEVFLSQEDALTQLRTEFTASTVPIIPQTLQDRRDIRAPKDTAGDKAKREEQRLQERLAKLRLERAEIAQITEFKYLIALAEADSDRLTARRIQGERRVFEIQQEQLEKLVGVKDER